MFANPDILSFIHEQHLLDNSQSLRSKNNVEEYSVKKYKAKIKIT